MKFFFTLMLILVPFQQNESLFAKSSRLETKNNSQSRITFKKILSKTARVKDFNKKIALVSEELLNTPYGFDQNGALNKFVCTTLVEHVLAISYLDKTRKYKDYQKNLDKIQYYSTKKRSIHFNHFFSLDWIPNLIRRGMGVDITNEVHNAFLPHTKKNFSVTNINKLEWFKVNLPSQVKSYKKSYPKKNIFRTRLQYISLKDIFSFTDHDIVATSEYADIVELSKYIDYYEEYEEHDDKEVAEVREEIAKLLDLFYRKYTYVNMDLISSIPTGTIVSVVRPNWNMKDKIGTNINVSHVGFAIWKNGTLYFRHASTTYKKVVDEEFITYFRRYLSSPSVKGVNFVLPLKSS